MHYAEVLFYFQWILNEECCTYALVVPYGEPDQHLLENSFGTVWAAQKLDSIHMSVIQVSNIMAVVGMVPHRFKTPYMEQEGGMLHFAAEKLSADTELMGRYDKDENLDGETEIPEEGST